MHIYRIAPKTFAEDMSGTGARIYGGRWNEKGVACIYASESRSLAMCEFAAHQTMETMPSEIRLITIDCPADSVYSISDESLPKNWRSYPAPFKLKEIGAKLLEQNEYLLVRIPSVIIPEESNLMINPMHPLMKEVKIHQNLPYDFDQRLKS